MQDRVPLYPGRVKMTPVAGQANTFDMVRADDPTQAGTPLNKATFLKDATAALFGKTNAAVPDDILNLLSKSVLAQTVGGKTTLTDVLGTKLTVGVQIETGSYVGTGTYGQANPNTLTFGFVPKFVWIWPKSSFRGSTVVFAGRFYVTFGRWGYYAESTDVLINLDTMSMSGNTLTWWNPDSTKPTYQLNVSDMDYYYLAIG